MTARIIATFALSLAFAGALAGSSLAQAPKPAVTASMPPAKPAIAEEKLPARTLFSAAKLPSIGKAVAIGYYPRGCLQGGVELPVDGPNWQVMRLSRNRNWGHPELVKFLERFAPLAAKATRWKGILVGDMAQPRGGPLPFGHLSHQIGLDVDIWFMPMPNHELSKKEREDISASNLVAADKLHVNPETWTPADVAFIRTAAEQPEVERVLVNAAIKKELCRVEDKNHNGWMAKVRPWYGHNDHIHVRLKCPAELAELPQSAAGPRWRWVRQEGAGLLVLGRDPAPEAAQGAGGPAQADHARRPAARLQKRARRAGRQAKRKPLNGIGDRSNSVIEAS